MAKKKNQILVEWWESKDASERNRVNDKHIVGDAESITVGGIISVKFNSRRYKASVIDLLGWTTARKCHTKMQKPTKSATVTAANRREGKSAVVRQRRPVHAKERMHHCF